MPWRDGYKRGWIRREIDRPAAPAFNGQVGAAELSIVITVFVLLGILIPVWIGLAAMRRGGKGGSWWTMLAGTIFIVLGLIAYLAGIALLIRSYSGGTSPGSSPDWHAFVAPGGLIAAVFGLLLFAFGFCFQGLRIARLGRRNEELEQLAAAMTEEIHSRRGGGEP